MNALVAQRVPVVCEIAGVVRPSTRYEKCYMLSIAQNTRVAVRVSRYGDRTLVI